LQPWPGTFSSFRGKNCAIWGRPLLMPSATVGLAGEILKADSNLVVSCGSATALRLEFVQLEGRKRVTALEFANGARLTRDDRFGD
jgi:methionyl-tRNA formyltransferase